MCVTENLRIATEYVDTTITGKEIVRNDHWWQERIWMYSLSVKCASVCGH